jgi:hypothetical protein
VPWATWVSSAYFQTTGLLENGINKPVFTKLGDRNCLFFTLLSFITCKTLYIEIPDVWNI